MIYLNDKGVVARDKKKLITFILLCILAVAASFSLILPALAHGNRHRHRTEVVKPADLALPPNATTNQDTWYFYDDNTNTPSTAESPGDYEFSTEVGGSHGAGAVKLAPESTERWNLVTNQLAGKKLSDLDELSFHQYTPASSTGGTSVTLFLNVDVDFDNTTATGEF